MEKEEVDVALGHQPDAPGTLHRRQMVAVGLHDPLGRTGGPEV